MKVFKNLVLFFFLFAVIGCKTEQYLQPENVQMAFLADIHFQDIYAEFEDANYKGIKNSISGEFANIRTMQSQLKSTRIFNENYFAFITALDDISEKGIKIVVLPGDFSDDGQPIHIKGLRRILDRYSEEYGISFLATTGNHDPVKPFSKEAMKKDFLGEGGKEQIIASSVRNLKILEEGQLKPIITSGIKNWGYKGVLNEMSDFGFYPNQDYLYWETPFSKYSYEDYNFKDAKKQAVLEKRTYQITTNLSLPDVSYLVEPIEGVWLLAIDANVYVPNKKASGLMNNPDDFSGASIGYNNVLSHKSHLIDWVKKVSDKARKHGKSLIAFSHYPMVDFNDDASSEMKLFFGSENMQLHRVPNEDVAKAFADAGIQIHFGGHMHINDTGVRTTEKGNTLFNIQTPSLAAYTPAYKILTILSDSEFEVETVVIDSVYSFNKLFPLYEQEYKYLEETAKLDIWNKDILKTKNYGSFTEWHLKELMRLRFIPEDWPKTFTEVILKSSGKDLLLMSQENIEKIDKQLEQKKWSLNDFKSWTGFDMIFDFYRLRNADELATVDIGLKRLEQYKFVCNQLSKSGNESFMLWQSIFEKTANGKPSNHFKINLKTNSIERINP